MFLILTQLRAIKVRMSLRVKLLAGQGQTCKEKVNHPPSTSIIFVQKLGQGKCGCIRYIVLPNLNIQIQIYLINSRFINAFQNLQTRTFKYTFISYKKEKILHEGSFRRFPIFCFASTQPTLVLVKIKRGGGVIV